MSASVRRVPRALLAVALVIAATAAACGSESASGSGKTRIVYAGFGGALGEAETAAWFEPFMEENPDIEVVYDDGVDFAKLKAMVETGNATWDVYTGDLYAPDADAYFEELDCELIPCDEIAEASNNTDHVTTYYTYSNLVTFDVGAFGDSPPQSWADFYDTEAFPGKRAMPRYSGSASSVLETALLADGVAPEDLRPIDFDRAFAKLDEIKDDIVWFDTNAQCPQLLRDGEATAGLCLNGRVYDAIQDGAELDMAWEQNISGAGAIAVVKGSKNAEAAQRLIAYILDAENNARLSEHIAYGPTNEGAFDQTNADITPYLLSGHEDAETVGYDWPYLRENGAEVTERFDEWLAG